MLSSVEQMIGLSRHGISSTHVAGSDGEVYTRNRGLARWRHEAGAMSRLRHHPRAPHPHTDMDVRACGALGLGSDSDLT